jgi:hypothetical protein
VPKKPLNSKARRNAAPVTSTVSGIGNRQDPRLEAAQRRLRESVGQADTLEAIREIVTNLLGCEEIGLFTVERGNSELLWSFGIDPQQHGTLDSFDESALRRVLQGEFHVAEVDYSGQGNSINPPLRAFIPICLNGRTVAVLVMLKFLPQKLGFDEADINLVKLLSDETGRSLFEGSANANA